MTSRIRRLLDTTLGTLVLAIFILLVSVVTWQVVSRLVGSPSGVTIELARFLLIWLALGGTAFAAGKGDHLSIDLFPNLSPSNQKIRQVFIHLVVLAFALGVMVFGGARLVLIVLELKQTSAALGVPMGYVYLILPISGLALATYTTLDLVDLASAEPASARGDSSNPSANSQ